MKAKKGISLIVLVITIIVIIILAAAVLLTLNDNNPIENANTAVSDNDLAETKSALTIFLSDIMADVQDAVVVRDASKNEITATADNATDANKITGNETIFTTGGKQVYYDEDAKKYTTADKNSKGTANDAVTLSAENLGIPASKLTSYKIIANNTIIK